MCVTDEFERILSEASDAKLVNCWKLGSKLAGEVLFERYKKRLYGFIYRGVDDHHDASDVFQETFCQFLGYVKEHEFRDLGSGIRPLLFRIAYCKILKNREGRSKKVANITHEPEYSRSILDEDIILEDALDSLTEEEHEIIKLRYYGQKTFQQIERDYGIPHTTAHRLWQQAMERLRIVYGRE